MPIYRYRGYAEGGGEASGTIEADGLRDAVSKVKGLGLHPKDVKPYVRRRRALFRAGREAGGLPGLTRRLSLLVRSGVPLAEALKALSEECPPGWRDMLVEVKERVMAGSSLSRALAGSGGKFPEFYTGMVAAGEESGTLDRVLSRLADFLESTESVKRKIRAALVYPVFMASVGVVVLAFLFAFVVPKIVRIFEDARSALPFATVALIKISGAFVSYWWAFAVFALLLLAGARAGVRRYRQAVDRALFGLFESLYLSRFSRSLGFLLGGGLPMLRALELSGRTSGNLHLEGIVRASAAGVSEGASLTSSLSGLPPVLLQLISTGEKTGRLGEVLEEAAGAYEAELERKVQGALALVEPLMILLMGLVVGFIVFAVLLPMFQLNELIK